MGSVASATIASGQAELMRRRPARLSSPRSGFAGFWYSPEVITLAVRHWAVRWYLRFGLSYCDVEELLEERGIGVDHVTVFRWVQRFTPLLIHAARPCRHAPGDRWFVDETYAKIAGRWIYLYRAIDQFGQVIDVLVSEKRDLAAIRRFFTRALDHAPSPIEVTTDRAAAYPRVLDELVPAACHVTERYGNNSIEADHGRLKSRLRPMRGLKQLRCARVIIAGHAFIQNIRCGHYELGALGGRGNSKPTGPGCLRRAGHGDLTNLDYRSFLPRLCTTQQPSPRPVPRKWLSLGCWPKATTSSPSPAPSTYPGSRRTSAPAP
jgi:IS6 family transposase